MHLHILNHCHWQELTGVAEARTHQTFVGILDNDVIEPLVTLTVSQKHLFGRASLMISNTEGIQR